MATVTEMSSMGRRRGGRFADRPRNVEINTIGDVTYFRYAFPDGQRKQIGTNVDVATAYARAEAYNGRLAEKKLDAFESPPARRPVPKNPSIQTLIAEFRKHDPKRKKYAESSRLEQDFKLNLYLRRWGTKTVQEIETTNVSSFLNELSDNAYVKHRAALFALFQFAGHQGYIAINPVAVTLIKAESAKVRERHTWDGYQKVLEASPEWLQRAMRIGLYSLQRREDVVLLHRTLNKVDVDAGTMTVLQRKTRNYKNPVWIEIEMGAQLRAAVEDCLRSMVLCPYLIHRKPDRQQPRELQKKLHPFAVTPDYLSKEFSYVRDECKAYDHLPAEKRPTFHELRALGTHLYKEAGFSNEYIMALSGHMKLETLERYQRDHEQKGPRRVSAGMSAFHLPK